MKTMFAGAASCAGLCLFLSAPVLADAPAWRGYAGNAQHTAPAPAKTQKFKHLHWQTPVDLDPQDGGGFLLIHYGSPMVTASNTVIFPVKTGTDSGFRIEAHDGATGNKLWQKKTDFVFAPHDWTPSFPAHLTAQNRLFYAGAGGTVYFRDTPDLATGAKGQLVFYGKHQYKQNKTVFDQKVMIDTPITADEAGNIYFGFVATGTNPAGLKSGVARIGADGVGHWVSAGDAAGDQNMIEMAQNCAPAVSNDGATIYIAVSDGAAGYLVGLDSATLAQKFKVRLKDPQSGNDAFIFDDSSASPTVGPDGDVFYGVVENSSTGHNSRGWLLHFSADLATKKTPGSFGWDDTVSVVPLSAVPSYAGTSPYLLMTKYNNYLGAGSGDGHNEIAIISPDETQKDRFSNVTVMKDVMTRLNPTHVPGQPSGAVYEWCINSAAVDAAGHAVIANAEDGHTYRWDLATDTLTNLSLNAPRGEAYTPTVVGPDGTAYAINDGKLYALGK
ncbi:MAG TPA: hypothetical protein VG889_07815 [Rhizomicrobium sp.]|nr:hypothetical protein [Rhizomicrobium sp.]